GALPRQLRPNHLAERCSALRGSTSRSAYTIIETLVYISLLFVILGLGYMAMYRSMDASAGLRRNAADIARALKAGEAWREDIRSANRPIRIEKTGAVGVILHVPQTHGEVTYQFSTNSVSRRVGKAEWTLVLDNVKNASFINDKREKIAAWRWELELQPYRKS